MNDGIVREPRQEEPINPRKKSKVLWYIIILVILGVIAYYAWAMFTASKIIQNPGAAENQAAVAKQVESLKDRLAKLTILPAGEEPTIVQVTNADELAKTQPFYNGSINGDVIFFYRLARKAYIYSPSRNLIVNVGPVYLEEEAKAATAQTATPKPAVKTPVKTAPRR